jgi:hypothetical protein
MNDSPREWVNRMWIAFEVLQEIENEQMNDASNGTTQRPISPNMEESLAGMSQIGM